MQFIANGPDLPEALLRAHEEGQVVFFCGAGISYAADLPGFQGLVDDIYNRVGTYLLPIEQEAYDRNQFDATLGLLERRHPGQRLAVRTALKNALQPKLHRKGATDSHKALLQLARNREGSLRLVTTNFDRIFERVAKNTRQSINSYAAPMLPISKNSRWDGLVYLHGLLPERNDESALNRLVLTSGDFGLAYLTERWAARFVSELFLNYVVCFVGYSIDDPVLRYMMDALAADRMLGELTPQAYALGDCIQGQEAKKTIEWEAKGVKPILYEVLAGSNKHSALHRTLKAWAETYRDGILGKERIVVDYAVARPSASTQQDDFVGRMLWALSHKSAMPANRFAEFNPVPPLEWLEVFFDNRYQHRDLNWFGVPPLSKEDEKLQFSLILRPTPYTHSPWMSLVSGDATEIQWDKVMFQLARWLIRHLNDPALVIWLTQHGNQLNSQFKRLIEDELNRFAQMEQEGKTTELAEIRSNAPNAIPGRLMQTLWQLLLSGRMKSSLHNLDLYRWTARLKLNGLTTPLRMELREILAPKVVLKKLFLSAESDEGADAPELLRQLVDWELELAAEDVHLSIQDLVETEHWRNALPILLNDFQQLLHDMLDLRRELGGTDDSSDQSSWDMPSISPHWQNRNYQEWITLIELLRDAWIAILRVNVERATRIAQSWFSESYSTFKRLALFAASQDNCIAGNHWVAWLVDDDALWLWSSETKRETMRLMVLQSAQLPLKARGRLETAILDGPPRTKYHDDIEPERLQYHKDNEVWLHLAKLQEGGSRLGAAAMRRFNDLSAANPGWELAKNESDEFSHWMSGTGDPDYEDQRRIDIAPRKRRELVSWLKQPPPSRNLFYENTWHDTCRTRFFHSFFALCDLAQEEIWPEKHWRQAFQVWSEEGQILRSWKYIAPLVKKMPDGVLQEIGHSFTSWLEIVSKSIDQHHTILLDLCTRLMSLQHQDHVTTGEPVTQAINHPIGHVTQTLLNLWIGRRPNDNDKLPEDIEPFYTQLCDTGVEEFRHGRVLLASRLIPLFRVDRTWTEAHLLPLFDWETDPVEARAAWEGFFWSPRLYIPLLIALKTQLLSTVHHYGELGKRGRKFARFLTYAALNQVEGYSSEDFQSAFGTLTQEGLQESARALVQALEGAGDDLENYWKNRVQPFWQKIWPKSNELVSDKITESLLSLCIAARDEFPDALATIQDWLHPIKSTRYVVRRLYSSGLSERFPKQALEFLSKIINDQPWPSPQLEDCLAAIVKAKPDLEQDTQYQRLIQYLRSHGI